MARSLIKRRQEAERERLDAYQATLRRVSRAERPAPDAQKCIAGQASIWSLRRGVAGQIKRLLTIEVDRANRAVQVRGLGNRSATPEERQMVGRWATARGIILPAC